MSLDASVVAAMARWPNVPDVYNWLVLDARGTPRVISWMRCSALWSNGTARVMPATESRFLYIFSGAQ